MRRLFNAIKIGFLAFRNPQTFQHGNLKMLTDLFVLIMKVSTEKRNMMTRLAFVHPENAEVNEICSIWCGAGMTSDPTKRISELIEENMLLKQQLSESLNPKLNQEAQP